MVETLESLQKIVKGTPIRVVMANSYTDNVLIIAPGEKEIVKQLNNNVGMSATTILEAKVRVYKKKKQTMDYVKFNNPKNF